MTHRCGFPEDLDRLFGPQEQQPEARPEQDSVGLLGARIAQLGRQQRVFEEAHQEIVAQILETSDALLTEQRSALARREQEVAARTKGWQERVAVLEQAKAVSEREGLAAQQRLLTLVYAIDAQMKAILDATAILGRDIHTVEAHEALESIRSGATALLDISDTCCHRDVRGAVGEDFHRNREDGDDLNAAGEADEFPADSGRPFDRDVALARAGGDKDLLKELVTLFLSDGPKHLLEAKTALDRGDGPALSRAAHTLKGAAGLFGATAVMRPASELEELRRVGDRAQAERIVAELEAALTRLLHALTACVGESAVSNATDKPTLECA